ncbi:unnamed protein product, partial [Anisakis simplex]|uniref:Chromosome transmission fidelity protein 18 homolog (inferred by orthology to a human protein) n=1 Tax=Anisakis simplex TaxID=6269 RepID=A0A0M3JJJ6_ANISI
MGEILLLLHYCNLCKALYCIERKCNFKIANSEHVRIESSALAELVGICALDLRSSINALQFLSIQSDAHSIDFSAVQKYGERESHVGEKSLFDGWASVFEMGRHMDGHGKVLELSARLQRVQTITQRFQSESEKFHLGLFSNYLSALSGMHRVPLLKDVTELFSEYDQLNSLMMHSQNY